LNLDITRDRARIAFRQLNTESSYQEWLRVGPFDATATAPGFTRGQVLIPARVVYFDRRGGDKKTRPLARLPLLVPDKQGFFYAPV